MNKVFLYQYCLSSNSFFVKKLQLVSRQTKVGFDRRLINNVYLLSLHLQVLILTQMIASDLPFDTEKLFLC